MFNWIRKIEGMFFGLERDVRGEIESLKAEIKGLKARMDYLEGKTPPA